MTASAPYSNLAGIDRPDRDHSTPNARRCAVRLGVLACAVATVTLVASRGWISTAQMLLAVCLLVIGWAVVVLGRDLEKLAAKLLLALAAVGLLLSGIWLLWVGPAVEHVAGQVREANAAVQHARDLTGAPAQGVEAARTAASSAVDLARQQVEDAIGGAR